MFNKPEEDGGYMDLPSVSSSNSTAARSTPGKNALLLLLGGSSSSLPTNESQQHDKTVAILEAIDAALDAIDSIEALTTSSIEIPAPVGNADVRKS